MSIVTLSSMISRSAQLLIAALPQNSRRASLTSASSAKVADSAVPSEAFVAAMYAATTGGSLVATRGRQSRKRNGIRGKAASGRSGKDGGIAQGLLRRGREHRFDLGERCRRDLGERRIAALIDIAQAEHHRLGLLLAEHQRREEQPPAQHVADAGLAPHRRALGGELRAVPIERALRDAKPRGQRRRRRPTTPAS